MFSAQTLCAVIHLTNLKPEFLPTSSTLSGGIPA